MTRKPSGPKGPLREDVQGLRQRQRSDGSWRVWWEPSAVMRASGATNVELDPARPDHAAREARRLNETAAAVAAGKVPLTGVQARTIRALIADYQDSRFFKALRPITQAVYRSHMRTIETKWSSEPVIAFTGPVCNAWYEALLAASGAHRARALLRMLSILFTHAETRGWREAQTNPVASLRMEAPTPRSRRCSWEEFDALMLAAEKRQRPMVALVVAMGFYTGQRVTDIFEARPEDFRPAQLGRGRSARQGLVWELTQSKTGKQVSVPIHQDLEEALRAQLAVASAGPGTLVWVAGSGKAFDHDSMGAAWKKLRDEAAKALPSIKTLTQRDLRRSFAINARAGGVTRDDLVDVLGNTLDDNQMLAQTYTPSQLATVQRVVGAIKKPEKERKQG